MTKQKFGNNVKFYRTHFGVVGATKLTQKELSKLSNINVMHISHFECGRRWPTIRNLFKLCKALVITPNDLLQ